MTTEPRLQLHLFGPPEAVWEGEVVRDFGSRKAIGLLAYLAVYHGPATRTHLVDLFWMDKTEASGRRNLSWVLSMIGKVLPDCLITDRHSVTFGHGEDVMVDTAVFDAAVRQNEIDALEKAVGLYRGDFLEGLYINNVPTFESWVATEREHWRQRLGQALQTLVTHYEERAEWSKVRRYVTQLLELDNWNEEAHRQLMRVLAWQGHKGLALSQYELCRDVLEEELGIEPDEETVALYEQILHDDLEEAPVAAEAVAEGGRHNLPQQLTPLIGRDDEVAELCARLQKEDCHLLTIQASGGMGKTRLGLQVAQNLLSEFKDGVYFVSLSGVDEQALLATIAGTLEVPLKSQQPTQTQLMHYLRQKEMLLVLDNFEHIIMQAPLVVGLLQGAPQVKVIVTSQVRLNVQGEWVFEVGGLAVPDEVDVDEAVNYSAVRLFLQGARRIRPDFVLTKGDVPAIARICQLVVGMPLGIELASSWVAVLSCQEIAKELEKDLTALTTAMVDMPERHRSLEAVFEHSWSLLTGEEQEALRRLAVFRGGFDRAAAGAVAEASLVTMAALVNKSFVQRSTLGRYQLHESLRQYAWRKLAVEPAVLAVTQERYSRYYAAYMQARESELKGRERAGGEKPVLRSLAEASRYYARYLHDKEADLKGGRQEEALLDIEAEIENIRASWNWLLGEGLVDEIDQFLESLFLFYDIRSWFEEGALALVAAVKLLRGVERPLPLGRALARQGWFQFHLGEGEKAMGALLEAIRLLEGAEGWRELPFCYNYLAAVYRHRRSLKEAEVYIQKSLDLCEELGDQSGLAIAWDIWGGIAYDSGDYRAAQKRCRRSLALKETNGDHWGMGFSLMLLGDIAQAEASWEDAEALFSESLAIRRELDDKRGIAQCLHHLGDVARAQNDWEKAQALYEESLGLMQAIGEQWGILEVLAEMAEMAIGNQSWDEARGWLLDGMATAIYLEAPVQLQQLGSRLATVLLTLEHDEEALLLATVVQGQVEEGGEGVGVRMDEVMGKASERLPEKTRQQLIERGRGMDWAAFWRYSERYW
ncbi:MAG TPA: BTAD domain-containing putative transcriptional regulator [Anaerolineae bacterium]|nr:BTAD domain-containing putative transcriptional regulator [Anaerolineae bacterium]